MLCELLLERGGMGREWQADFANGIKKDAKIIKTVHLPQQVDVMENMGIWWKYLKSQAAENKW